MRFSSRPLLGGAVAVFAWTSGLWADGFRNPPDTAAALGKAGKHIVWGEDATAVFYNPANLAHIPGREAQISALLGYSHADYEGVSGRTETERPWGLLPGCSLAWPLPEKAVVFALGMHVPYGRRTRWDPQGAFPIETEMSVVDLSPALAWRLSKSLAVGAGLDVYYGRLQFRQSMGPLSRIKADADGFAAGATAGLTWDVTSRQRLAASCRAPFDLKFEGDLQAANIPPEVMPSVPESDLDTTFKFPTVLALGYGIQLTETVRIEANVEWLQFSRYKTMAIHAGGNATLAYALGLASAPQNWDDTWTFGLGGEWRLAPEWTLRAGYLYLQSPIPDETFAPLALDGDQSVVSLGLGYAAGRHGVDFAYALGLFADRRVRGNQQPAYDGTYAFEGHLAALSYTYRF